jgi:hypothetical protein
VSVNNFYLAGVNSLASGGVKIKHAILAILAIIASMACSSAYQPVFIVLFKCGEDRYYMLLFC